MATPFFSSPVLIMRVGLLAAGRGGIAAHRAPAFESARAPIVVDTPGADTGANSLRGRGDRVPDLADRVPARAHPGRVSVCVDDVDRDRTGPLRAGHLHA